MSDSNEERLCGGGKWIRALSLLFGPLPYRNCKCFLHRCLAFRQGEECVHLATRERDFEPRLHFRALGLQLHFARQARRRTRGPTSLKKGTATVAFRELGNKCGTVAGKAIL